MSPTKARRDAIHRDLSRDLARAIAIAIAVSQRASAIVSHRNAALKKPSRARVPLSKPKPKRQLSLIDRERFECRLQTDAD